MMEIVRCDRVLKLNGAAPHSPTYHIYDYGRTFNALVSGDNKVIDALGDDLFGYFEAERLPTDGLVVGKRVSDQRWDVESWPLETEG